MYEKIPSLIGKSETISYIGKIENVVGMSMEASGGRASIGDIVMIYNEEQNRCLQRWWDSKMREFSL